MYHSEAGRFPRNPRIFNLISEMAQNDSLVPSAIPAQFLPGVIIVVLGGSEGAAMQCQMAWTMRGWMLQPVRWPVR